MKFNLFIFLFLSSIPLSTSSDSLRRHFLLTQLTLIDKEQSAPFKKEKSNHLIEVVSSTQDTNQTPLLPNNQSSSKKIEKTKFKTTDPVSNSINKITQVTEIILKNNSLEIHNKALVFLKENKKGSALLLLKANAYQNFFPASYLTLFYLKIPILFTPLIWHLSLFFMVLICILNFLLFFKKNQKSCFKNCFWSVTCFTLLLLSGSLLIKKRVSSLQALDLKSSPFQEASSQIQIPPNFDLIVLKETNKWFRVKSLSQQKGWVSKDKLIQIF